MTDAIYTPAELAAEMTTICCGSPTIVADFSAGGGELLRAARAKWPQAVLIGTDVAPSAVAALRRDASALLVGKCDFLSERSRKQCKALGGGLLKADLVLLNPPFSCRGGTQIRVNTSTFATSCGVALAFVLHAFEFLRVGGELIAILPAGSMTAQKDRNAWQQLNSKGRVIIRKDLGHRTFASYAPSTILVHITKCTRNTSSRPSRQCAASPKRIRGSVLIFRGSVQMHRLCEGTYRLIHSTELSNYAVTNGRFRTSDARSTVCGPFVAVGRVGSPRKDKVALHLETERVVLSDCVIAFCCKTPSLAIRLHRALLSKWDELKVLYSGTGAKYVTIQALDAHLVSLGFDTQVHAKSSVKTEPVRQD